MDTQTIVTQLRDEATRLTKVADILENKEVVAAEPITVRSINTTPLTPAGKNRMGRRVMSAAARKRISDAQKARWAAQKAA